MEESPSRAEILKKLEEAVERLRKLVEEAIEDEKPNKVAARSEAPNDWWRDPIEIPELGLKITSKDYYEILPDGTKKEYFTWDEAMEIEKKTNGKWRLPTCVEMMKIACVLGEKDGDVDRDTLVEALKLEQKGWVDEDGDTHGKGKEGNWWTSTELSSGSARSLNTYTTRVYPRDSNYKGFGFSVRCVAASS